VNNHRRNISKYKAVSIGLRIGSAQGLHGLQG
jgi:hypothetical protein